MTSKINTNFFKLKLNIQTLSPILIWSGEELVFDKKNKQIIVADEYEKQIFWKSFENIEIKEFNLNETTNLKLFSYYINPNWERIRYLPGSTIKGFLRSLVIFDIKKKVCKNEKEEITKDCVNYLNDINKYLDKIFRFIQVRDVVLEDQKDKFWIYYFYNLHRDKKYGNSSNSQSIINYFEWFNWNVDVEIIFAETDIKRFTNNWELSFSVKLWKNNKVSYKSGGQILTDKFWNDLVKQYSKHLKQELKNRIDNWLKEECKFECQKKLNWIWSDEVENIVKIWFNKWKETYFVGKEKKTKVSVNVVKDLQNKEILFAGLVNVKFLKI